MTPGGALAEPALHVCHHASEGCLPNSPLLPPSWEPCVQSLGVHFHRGLCGDSSRPGGRLRAKVPTDAVPGIEGVVHAG